MAFEEFSNGGPQALQALLFTTGALYALDTFSSLHSSPYTAEVRGGDPENAARVRHYVNVSIAVSLAMGVVASAISRTAWPLVGAGLSTAGMWWTYEAALRRAGSDREEELG